MKRTEESEKVGRHWRQEVKRMRECTMVNEGVQNSETDEGEQNGE